MQEQRRRDEQLNCTVEPSTVPGPFPRKCSLACTPRNHTEAHGSVHGASPERIQTLLFQVHVAQLPFMGLKPECGSVLCLRCRRSLAAGALLRPQVCLAAGTRCWPRLTSPTGKLPCTGLPAASWAVPH